MKKHARGAAAAALSFASGPALAAAAVAETRPALRYGLRGELVSVALGLPRGSTCRVLSPAFGPWALSTLFTFGGTGVNF